MRRVVLSVLSLLALASCRGDTPALWQRVDGRWTYDGVSFAAADPASLAPIDGRFARDDVQGYYRGVAIPGSHGPTFEVLGEHEARDRRTVFWADTYRKGQEYYTVRHVRVIPIAEADPARYTVLPYGYGRDGRHAFREGTRLTHVRDAATFEVLTPRLSRDARRAYFEDIEIPDSDGATFAIIDVQHDAWVRDRERVWHVRNGQPAPGEPVRREVRVLTGAVAAALRPLGREYATDGRRVWWRGAAVTDADVASFQVIAENDTSTDSSAGANGQADARDGRGRFARGKRLPASPPAQR